MNPNLLLDMVEALPVQDAGKRLRPAGQKKVADKTLSYSSRHRGQWFKPDFNFQEISIARKTDGFLFRSVQKKVNRIMVAGFSFVGKNAKARDYLIRRLREMAWATQTPLEHLVEQTLTSLFSNSNAAWIKKRDPEASSGLTRLHFDRTVDPVAAYFIVDFDTLELKTKRNGEPKKWRQTNPQTGETIEFFPYDVVHFRTNQDPGYSVGFPELYPALDDIALLRRIEENVEDLIEANLFPLFHYQVGTDELPEMYGPDGRKETDVVKDTIEYMPAGGVYVSDHRHKIEAIGSEGRALRIDFYLTYFRNRALASAGTTAVDMGEGDSSNKSTASTLSKGTLLDVEAMTKVFKRWFDLNVITELLLEGGFDPWDEEEGGVEIRFGIIDKEERRADENQEIQMWINNVRTIDQVRQNLGDEPWADEMGKRTFHSMYGEPAALLKAAAPGSAASAALASHPNSAITPQAIKQEEQFAKSQLKIQKQASAGGRPATKTNKTSANRARPSNQHKTRSGPKTNRDMRLSDGEFDYLVVVDTAASEPELEDWEDTVYRRWELVRDHGVSLETVIYNLLPQLET